MAFHHPLLGDYKGIIFALIILAGLLLYISYTLQECVGNNCHKGATVNAKYLSTAFKPFSLHLALDKIEPNDLGLTLLDYEPVTIDRSGSIFDKHDAIISLAQQPQIVCHNWRLFGRTDDGGWPVCLAPSLLPTNPCVVYSYGINYDWSFDDAYQKEFGCLIRTFDPSMDDTREHVHAEGVYFYPVGLSAEAAYNDKGWELYTHKQHLLTFNETDIIIPYLKFDVESYEFAVLHNMIKDDVLKNVMQLSFEIHVPTYFEAEYMFDALKKLEDLGFRRWFYHHKLNGFAFQCDQSFINVNFL